MSVLSVRIVGLPESHARPRVGSHSQVYQPKTSWFSLVYGEAFRIRPPAPLDSPLNLKVTFYFPRPKSASREKIFKSTKPDLDNLLKAVKDALTQARWWTDDGRVARMVIDKRFVVDGEASGAEIEVTEIQ